MFRQPDSIISKNQVHKITAMAPKAEIPVDKNVEDSFLKLQQIETEIQKADCKVEQFKNQIFTPIYNRRREYLNSIPKFWYIVLAQHEDFQEYISVEDMKYLELISDLYVEFWDETIIESNEKISMPKKGFTISISFKLGGKNCGKDNKMDDQTVVKKFEWVIDPSSGSRKLESEPITIKWPKELTNIDPVFIKRKAKDENRKLTVDEKKKYRQGMRSFFSFWQWTGKKPGKEYRNGEELATLIAEDIFPAALDYYVLAAPGLGADDNDEDNADDDDESEEELDLSGDEDEDDDERPDLKRQKVD